MRVDHVAPTACQTSTIGRLRAAYPHAWAQLRRIRGVSGLGIGLDARDGDGGWRVYVDDDQPGRRGASVPAIVAGFATTLVPRAISHACYGSGREPTLKPGIEIRPYCKGTGTLGCFARLKDGTNKIVILSAAHVLYDGGPDNTGRNVGQPSIWCCWWCRTRGVAVNRAFTVHKATVNVTVPGPPSPHAGPQPEGFEVDAAAATLNRSRPYTNESEFYGMITGTPASGLGVVGGVGGTKVEFVGCTSGHQTGTILKWATKADYVSGGLPGVTSVADTQLPITISGQQVGSRDPFVNRLWMIPTPHANPQEPVFFVDEGDSGAAVVNDAREVIGLVTVKIPLRDPTLVAFINSLLASPSALPPHVVEIALVCPIGPVLRDLNIEIVANMAGTAPASDEELAIPEAELLREREEAIALEGTLNDLMAEVRTRPIGRELLTTLDRHLPEIRELVNRKAEVTVAWHRSHGPGWAAHAINSIRDHRYVIPRDIQGVTRADMVTRMAAVLRKHGSPALRAALDRDESLIRDCVTTAETSVWSIIERLRRTYEPDAALAGAMTSR